MTFSTVVVLCSTALIITGHPWFGLLFATAAGAVVAVDLAVALFRPRIEP